MEVNDALVDKLANLARLQFDDTEKSGIKNDLQRMIQFVEKLNELDLQNFYLANGYKLVQNEYAGYDGCMNSKEVPYLCLS